MLNLHPQVNQMIVLSRCQIAVTLVTIAVSHSSNWTAAQMENY